MDDPTHTTEEKRRPGPSMLGFGLILFGVVMLFVFPPLFLRREVGRSCPMNDRGELHDCTYEYAEPLLPVGVRWAVGTVVALLLLAYVWRRMRRRTQRVDDVTTGLYK